MKDRIRIFAIALVVSCSASAVAQGRGEETYKSKCTSCHAADGSGNTSAGKATKTPPFSSPEMLKMSDAEFILYTKNGRGRMPAYASRLSDKEIADVVAYIRTLQKK
jgi:mono/diheme cytochrome c family protein